MSTRARNANGRAVPARVRGENGGALASPSNLGVSAGRAKAPRATGGGKASLRRPKGPAGAPGKYGNQRIEVDGQTFDSKREWARYGELMLLQGAGMISGLRRQVGFELAPGVVINGRRRPALKYIADFVYLEVGSTRETIEDVKGKVTEGYRIKRHLMASLGFVIKEIR